MKTACLTAALVMVLAVTACSSASVPTPAPPRSASPGPAPTARATAGSAASPASKPAIRRSAAHVTLTRVRTADGSVVTVAVFRGPVRYVLHDGTWDPYSEYSHLVKAGPRVGTAERGRLLAAFNGGFLMRSLAGGYEQEGYVFRKLASGLASLIINPAGHARIGVWGPAALAPGQVPYDVRQNLWPLVLDGQVTGALSASVPGQHPPATQYLKGWTRDFVTVLAAS